MEIAPSERRARATAPRVLLRGAFPAMCALLFLLAGLLPAASAQEQISAKLDNSKLMVKPDLAEKKAQPPAKAKPADPAKATPADPAKAKPADPAKAKPADDEDDAADSKPKGTAVGISGCVVKLCLNANPPRVGEDGQLDIDGSSVAIGGDGGDGSSLLALGIGVCLIAACDQVGEQNGTGGKGGAATAKDGKGTAVALGGAGGNGGLVALGVGICALLATCDDVGSNNGTGGNGGPAEALGGSGAGTGVAAGGDGGDGGLLGIGLGACILIVTCDDVGSNNGAGGNGGLAKVLGGSGDGTGVALGGAGGDGGIGIGAGLCGIGLLVPASCEDVGSDNSRGGKGGSGIVDGVAKKKGDVAVAIGGDGGDGGIGVGAGACIINLLIPTPCGDVGSNSARGGIGGNAKAVPGAKADKPVADKPVHDDKGAPSDDGKKEQPAKPAKDEAKPSVKEPALVETGRASVPLMLIALVSLILGVGLVGAARRFDRRNSVTTR
jgi:hypothetical protein